MTTIDTLPDSVADLDDLYTRLDREGILDDPRKRQEPFKRFVEAYNSFQMNLKAAPDIVEQHRQAARAVAPAVRAALGASPAPANDTTQDAASPPGRAKGAQGEGQRAAPMNTKKNQRAPTKEPNAPEPSKPTTTAAVEIPFHAVANIFPLMSQADLKKLANDIKENGLREAIWLHDGKIIDGRNRYRACLLAGVEPRFQQWDGNGSLVTFVLSLNLHRRHLTDQQRALVAVRVMQEFEAEAVERSRSNLLQNKGSTEGANLPPRSDGRSADRAAALLQVSATSIKKAAKLLMDGSPELVAAVELDQASLDAAALVATLPSKEQRKIVEQGKVKEKAKELRAAKAKPKTKHDAENGSDDGGATQERPTKQADDGDAGSTATTTSTTTSGATSNTGEKPTSTQAQDEQKSSSASEDKSGDDQTGHQRDATHAKADTSSATDPEAAPPDIKFEDALAVVIRAVRENDDDFAVKVLDQIATERDFLVWVRAGKSKAYRESLAEVVDQIVDEGLRTDAKTTIRWARSLVEQVRSQLGDSDA